MKYLLGVLITGGDNYLTTAYVTAEIYLPDSNTSCTLPDIPNGRTEHSQDGDLGCGGYNKIGEHLQNCFKLSNGVWTQTHNLRMKRPGDHVTWDTASGLYLMGGWISEKTSELVKKDGSVEEGFNLKYETMYNLKYENIWTIFCQPKSGKGVLLFGQMF